MMRLMILPVLEDDSTPSKGSAAPRTSTASAFINSETIHVSLVLGHVVLGILGAKHVCVLIRN
jgi:hypothetical protein